MLYLTGISGKYEERLYYIVETHTESIINCGYESLKELVNAHKMHIAGVKTLNKDINLKEWPHQIEGTQKHVLLAKIDNGWFKVASAYGSVKYITSEELKQGIEEGLVANCDTIKDGNNTIYRSIDTYNAQIEPEFKSYIDSEYRKFRAKSLVLGMDISFGYDIEGTTVRLKELS